MTSWRFENTYARLPEAFFRRALPASFPEPRPVLLNEALARDLGLDLASDPEDDPAALFSGQALPPGSDPIAQAYAGHQFGHFTMLGDGRALLLGEHVTSTGARVDIQFKGSGPTPYSRRGDGLAALGPMLREYVMSEAMHALGIPTTRSLAVVATGETVVRETPRPGAVLTRVAASHLRVGTFEYAAALQDEGALRALADYAVARHDPELVDSGDKYAEFLRAVVRRQASLVARWQLVGFVHGVMNTDNMAISGETIDYGPCAFLDAYHPDTVFSSIDCDGRYAYGNQPDIAHWNLTRLAESLLPLLGATEDEAVAVATEILNTFPPLFEEAWWTGMHRKLGLRMQDEASAELVMTLLAWMERTGADFTNTFRALGSPDSAPADPSGEFGAWHARWLRRRQSETGSVAEQLDLMRSANPDVIPRNHLVEAALVAAEEDGDLALLQELLKFLETPYAPRPTSKYHEAAPTGAGAYRTFCGT